MSTFVLTLPDDPETGFARWEPWDVIVAMFPEVAGDCMYAPPPDPHTGDQIVRHVRLDVTIRKVGP